MDKKHTANKFYDAINLRRGRKLYEDLFEKYGIEGLTFQDKMLALGKQIHFHDGIEKPQREEQLDGEGFDCHVLCKNFRGCTFEGMGFLEEIKANHCYVPNYPKYCKFLMWQGNPHGDPDHPYPKCLDPKPPIAIPRDRIVRNPQICWKCMMLKKRLREEKMLNRAIRGNKPIVDWGNSEYMPSDFSSY